MKDRLSLVAIVISVVVFIGVLTTVILLQNSHYATETNKLKSQLATLKTEYSDLKAEKDTNGFTPTEVVIAFLNEVKSDNTANAKLYLSSTVQDMDIKNTLKLGSDLANINIGETDQNISDSDATVGINIQVGTDTVARQFKLTKENDAWKITGVIAN